MKELALGCALLLSAAGTRAHAASACATALPPLAMPGGAPGIGFDDLHFAPASKLLLVPAGRSGRLDLVEGSPPRVVPIPGFSEQASFSGGHDDSVTSADEGAGLLFATDRTADKVNVVDLKSHAIVSSAALASGPDYVRYVAPTHEVWVSEPEKEQIEVFALRDGAPPKLEHLAVIAVPGGPESLVVDPAAGRAYTHLWKGKSLAIDVRTRKVGQPWVNGCKGSRGIALDGQGGLFAACSEGVVSLLDTESGKVRDSLSTGLEGVDVVDFDPVRRHLYLAAGRSKEFAIVGFDAHGRLAVLAKLAAAAGSHCAATDWQGRAYVCDPGGGKLLVFEDRCGAAGSAP